MRSLLKVFWKKVTNLKESIENYKILEQKDK